MKLKKYKLGDIGEIRMCKRILKSQTTTKGDIPFYKIGTFGKEADTFISRKIFNSYKERYNFPNKGDVLISAAGTIGRCVIYNGEDSYYQDSNIVWVNNDESIVLNDYLFYVLNNITWIPSKGSTILRLYNDDIRNKDFIVPNLEYQRVIADTLKAIDKKIKLNRQINDNLEAMAKQLYDYWFVQFDFPNEEGKSYKSSGGAMVWNEKLKREIPQGWNAAKIVDVAQTYSGGTPTSTNKEYYDGGDIPWINSGELNYPIITSTSNYITEKGLNKSSAKLYPPYTVLVALYGATAGKVSLLSFEACSNQAVCGVIPNDNNMTIYTRYYLASLYEHFIALSSGSARDNISQDTIKNTVLPIPQQEIIKKYSDTVAPIINKIITNQHEIENLTKQRDELLPLLMNGQASVNYHLSVYFFRAFSYII